MRPLSSLLPLQVEAEIVAAIFGDRIGLKAEGEHGIVRVADGDAGLLAGMALTVAHTLGEFGVVLMVGGNIEGETRTLSVSLYDKVQGMDLQSAHVMALALVGVSLLALSLVLAFDRVGQRGRALQER